MIGMVGSRAGEARNRSQPCAESDLLWFFPPSFELKPQKLWRFGPDEPPNSCDSCPFRSGPN